VDREARILSLSRMVAIVAARTYRSIPRHVDLEDLTGAGWVGAIGAVDRWDPKRGVLLETYAETCIRGAMQDYLRSLDDISRDHRRNFKAAVAAALLAGAPEPAPLPSTVHLFILGDKGNEKRPLLEQLGRKDPGFARAEMRADIVTIFNRAKLLPRERSVMIRHYLGDEKMKAIGGEFGISECRVSQIRKRAVEKLRLAA
jgi:RNA polymerase sigma factor for flagellar operon FliA